MTNKIVVLSSCAREEEAEALARRLVEERLAACVSVVPRMHSYYRWQGAVETADECLLVIKSSRELFSSLVSTLESNHSYEVPEALALSVLDGSANYMSWMDANLRGEGESR